MAKNVTPPVAPSTATKDAPKERKETAKGEDRYRFNPAAFAPVLAEPPVITREREGEDERATMVREFLSQHLNKWALVETAPDAPKAGAVARSLRRAGIGAKSRKNEVYAILPMPDDMREKMERGNAASTNGDDSAPNDPAND